MKIKWKKLDDSYFISSNGIIKSINRKVIFYNFNKTKIKRKSKGKILSPMDNGHGYLYIHLGRKTRDYIHRLVAKAFIPNLQNKRCINHKNGIKTDNRVENLEWVTDSENQIHSKNTGLCKIGEKHPQSKLTNANVLFIRDNYELGLNFLSNKFKVAKPTIWSIGKYHSRKHG